jgi:hypothetical protein
MKKTILALALATFGGYAMAGPFYIDNNTDWDGLDETTSDALCANCTTMLDEITYIYESTSTVIEQGTVDGVIEVGDLILTNGGLNYGPNGYASNAVTNFNPVEGGFGTTGNNNDFNNQWVMSFDFSGLMGQIAGIEYGNGTDQDPTFLQLQYGPGGVIDLYYQDITDPGNWINFMDVLVTGGTTTGTGTAIIGTVDFTDVDAAPAWMYNLFHSGQATCNGSDSFYDIWSNCDGTLSDLLTISFYAHFDTDPTEIDFTYLGDGEHVLQGLHDGSAEFNIPEPATLALVGTSMLLLGGARRRKKSA